MLGGTIVPMKDLRLKHYQSQKGLRIVFKGRPISCPNPKILEPHSASGGLLCPVLIPFNLLLSLRIKFSYNVDDCQILDLISR
jgi:hypothetical protein